MDKANDNLWLAFEALARTYPHDDGMRMTVDLARWRVEEGERQRLAAPAILTKVVRTVSQALHSSVAAPVGQDPQTSE